MLETVLIILGVTVYFGGVRIQALSLTSVCFSLCNDQYLCLLSENNNTELLELFSGINEIMKTKGLAQCLTHEALK